MSIRIVCAMAAKIDTDEQEGLLLACLRSIDWQSKTPDCLFLALSGSKAKTLSFDSVCTRIVCLRLDESGVAQFEAYRRLFADVPELASIGNEDARSSVFVMFSDADDLWHQLRYEATLVHLNSTVMPSDVVCAQLSTFATNIRCADSARIMSASAVDDALRDGRCKLDSINSKGSPEYVQLLPRLSRLREFLASFRPVLSSVVADRFLCAFLRRTTGQVGLLRSQSDFWVYFYRKHHNAITQRMQPSNGDDPAVIGALQADIAMSELLYVVGPTLVTGVAHIVNSTARPLFEHMPLAQKAYQDRLINTWAALELPSTCRSTANRILKSMRKKRLLVRR